MIQPIFHGIFPERPCFQQFRMLFGRSFICNFVVSEKKIVQTGFPELDVAVIYHAKCVVFRLLQVFLDRLVSDFY
jgi:hypothetical protein